jgi:hypothetical protein
LLKNFNQCLLEGDDFLENNATGDDSWDHYYDPENKRTIHGISSSRLSECKEIQNYSVSNSSMSFVFDTHDTISLDFQFCNLNCSDRYANLDSLTPLVIISFHLFFPNIFTGSGNSQYDYIVSSII